MDLITKGVQIGIAATVSMDIAALIARHGLRLPTGDWTLLGRWFGYWFRGVLVHRPIGESPPIAHELAIGWVGHYVTGIAYGVGYMTIVGLALNAEPSVGSAMTFGVVTLAAPWLLVQPAMGAGVCASKTPRPWLTRGVNALIHVVFGASLYVGWWLVD